MKKIYLLALIVLIGFVACSDDDDDNPVYTKTDLVGTWEYKSKEVLEVVTNNTLATEAIKNKILFGPGHGEFIFSDNGKVTLINFGAEDENGPITEYPYYGTYSVGGNKLTLNFENPQTYPMFLVNDMFSYDVDFTESYQKYQEYLVEGVTDVVVSKVMVRYTFARK